MKSRKSTQAKEWSKDARRVNMGKVYYSLYDRMLHASKLREAFKRVKSKRGAAGIDGQTIDDFAASLEENLTILARELREKSYKPLPVRRVEIPKARGGVRELGIPAVRDRVVQQVMLSILQPIFEEDFHPSSYGYRPGKSQHQAIAKATMFIRQYEMEWVVDMDLSKCFDSLEHDIIIKAFRRRVTDGSILRLLKMFLKSGVMIGGEWHKSEKGSPQGGVISPLIANVYLDSFDQFMKARNHRIVRYADDILIFTRSKSAAKNAQKQASRYLKKELKLTVNKEKTHIVHSSEGVKFLGVEIYGKYTKIQDDKIDKFKDKVKKITRRNSPVNLEKVIGELNPVSRGFANYFKIANCSTEFRRLMQWTRRRLRAKQFALWKTPKRLHRRLRQLGYRREFKSPKMRSWRSSASKYASFALPNEYFEKLGLYDLTAVQTGIFVSVT
jgi:RNA-directed DNA polymerase